MDRSTLLALYQIAHAEYRAEVALGHSRARFFLVLGLLGPVLAAFSAGALATRALCAFSMAFALAGILVVEASHGHYRAARVHLQRLEDALGAPGLTTTGGMREARGGERGGRVRVIDVTRALLVLEAVVSAVLVLIG